ncbi:MAG: metal ABC transporter permease [Planctomycetota bacterium]|nr:metal ABC transporter permease [Planctomycetota bacterium]
MSELSFFDAVASTPLLQRALVAGGLAGVSCAALAPLVVLRRMAFIGDGMAHAAFGGLGVALFVLGGSRYEDLGVQLLTLAFCLALALAIGRASREANGGNITEDSAIGIAFSVSMALGAVFIALRQRRDPQYVTSMDTYLFGNLLNIGPSDVAVLSVLTLTVLAVLVLFQKEILFYAFDARLAEVSGLNTGLLHHLILLLLVLTVVIASRVMGIVLVSSSLVLPGVIALRLCTRMVPAMVLAAIVGLVSFEVGLYASYACSVQPGAAIVLVQFAVLLVAAGARKLWRMG